MALVHPPARREEITARGISRIGVRVGGRLFLDILDLTAIVAMIVGISLVMHDRLTTTAWALVMNRGAPRARGEGEGCDHQTNS